MLRNGIRVNETGASYGSARMGHLLRSAQSHTIAHAASWSKHANSHSGNSNGNSNGNSSNNSSKKNKHQKSSQPNNQSSPAQNSNRNFGSNKNNNSGPTPTLTPQPEYVNKLGKDGKLTSEERERRKANNLCLFCGQSGHSVNNCPKSSSNASKTKARASALVSNSDSPSNSKK